MRMDGADTPVVTARARRFMTVVAAHPVVDTYSQFVPPLIGVLQVRCELTDYQEASLLGIGSLASGMAQPLVAWAADRMDSRLLGALGLLLAAVCLSSVGLATNYTQLVVLFVIGMAGVGAFHPIAAASAGQLAGARRTAGVTLFFAAGMLGAAAGPLISTRITAIRPDGFDLLRWCMIPGVVMAAILYFAVRRVSHGRRVTDLDADDVGDIGRRWGLVILLFVTNAMRYSVNVALIYLLVQFGEAWVMQAQGLTDEKVIAEAGSAIAGNWMSAMMIGMGVGGLAAGALATPARERWLFTVIPLVFAPMIALFAMANDVAAYALAFFSGVGFAAVIPVSIGAAQRLLPHRTSVASSFTMGGAWAVATCAPILAAWGIDTIGLPRTFAVTAMVLALSGVIGLWLKTGRY